MTGGFAAMILLPLLGILALYTLVMIVVSAVKSHQGDYVEIALSAEFIK